MERELIMERTRASLKAAQRRTWGVEARIDDSKIQLQESYWQAGQKAGFSDHSKSNNVLSLRQEPATAAVKEEIKR